MLTDSQNQTIAAIREMQNPGGFLTSILGQFDRRGSLTDRQWEAATRVVRERANGQPRPSVNIRLVSIIAMFEEASKNVRWPKIEFDTPFGVIVLRRCGRESSREGAVNVTDNRQWADRRWFGRIERDGSLSPGQAMTEDVANFLKWVEQDPAGAASEMGRRTGQCCFCGKRLTDPASVEVGYGPICAENYGLPHGGSRN